MQVEFRVWLAPLLAAVCLACSDDSGGGPMFTGTAGAAGSSVAAGAPASSPPAAGATGGMPAAGSAGMPAGALDAGMMDAAAPPSGGMPAAGGGAAGAPAMDAGTMDPAPDSGAPMPDTCDRACLLAVMQGYVDALIANDPSKLKVSSSLKYTENGATAKLGETVWQTAETLVEEARLDFADPVEGNVATHLVFNEAGDMPVLYQVRLKVVKHEITEIETMVVRRRGAANGFFNPANMVPEPAFVAPVDPAKRMSREDLRAITELYLDYLEGEKSAREVPFDMGCKRYENGQVTASGLSSFNAQSWSFNVTRRILVIDEEAGITWGNFPFTQSPTTLVVGEAFKIVDGKIMMIQAIMANMPARAWD